MGNFLDFWLQSELLFAATGEAPSAEMQQILFSLYRGAYLRRVLWLRPQRTLVEHTYWHSVPAALLPASELWRTDADLAALVPKLRASHADILWHNRRLLSKLEPHIRSALRELLTSFLSLSDHDAHAHDAGRSTALAPPSRVLPRSWASAPRTSRNGSSAPDTSCCVVHLRLGQSQFWQRSSRGVGQNGTTQFDQSTTQFDKSLVDKLIRTARYRTAPACFEVLDGGTNHLCTPSASNGQCGAVVREELLRKLRAAAPSAAVTELTSGLSPDTDFLRMACATKLLLGAGSSFNTFAALAARAEVRGLSMLGSRHADVR